MRDEQLLFVVHLDSLTELPGLAEVAALHENAAAVHRQLGGPLLGGSRRALLLLGEPRLFGDLPCNEALGVLSSVHGQVHLELPLGLAVTLPVVLPQTEHSARPIFNGDPACR